MINSTVYSKVSDAEERFESYPLPPEVSMNKKKQITKYYTKIAKILKKDSNAKFQFTDQQIYSESCDEDENSAKKDQEPSKKRSIVFDQNSLGERYFNDTINGIAYPEDEKDEDDDEMGRFRNKRVTEVPEVSSAKEGKTSNGHSKKPEKLIVLKGEIDLTERRDEQNTAMLKKNQDAENNLVPDSGNLESAPISPWQ
uniref:Uncharacterized protein n=1 Tax=Strombidium inclinatum TaxID=197538 RepID=A0A7S3IDC2_9SPIT|mmetsp:Transcript_10968/g.16634  ORF Transcript_10968/g.16634 Transcript_10968/m.16634 type:complete len:198 (+) Transcript_10968:840-1433(+)